MAKMSKHEKGDFLLNKDVAKKLQASFAILLSNYLEIWHDGYWSYAYGQPEEVKQIRANIGDSIANLSNIMRSDGERLSGYIKGLAEDKKTLAAIERSISAYLNQLGFLSFVTRNCNYNRFFEKNQPEIMDVSRIVSDCMVYVTEPGARLGGNTRKGDVLSAFPVKMTRQRFYDYVRGSALLPLDAAHGQGDENIPFTDRYITRSQFIFKPDATESFGAYFPEAAERIRELSARDLSGMDDTALDAYGDAIAAISDELTIIHDFMLLLFESVNSLMILSTFGGNIKYLFDNDFQFRDAYGAILENMNADNRELYNETLASIVSTRLESVMESVPSLNERSENLLSDPVFREREDIADLLKVRNAITSLFFENLNETALSDIPSGTAAPSLTREYIHQRADNMAGFVKDILEKEPLNTQRLLKQFYFTRIFCPLSDEEFLEYIREGFRTARDEKQAAVIAANIASVFSRSGFGNFNETAAEN